MFANVDVLRIINYYLGQYIIAREDKYPPVKPNNAPPVQ